MVNRLHTAAAAVAVLAGAPALAQETDVEQPLEVRVWLDRGDEAVLMRGDRVRIYYRTSTDGYVSIFHIDTDGVIRLLFPRSPDEEHFVRAGTDFRLLFPRSPFWYVDEDEGQGYFFAVASPWPLDFTDFRYAASGRDWDLTAVGRTVYSDPYLAMDEYVARLIPDWETMPYALDFITYDVGTTHDYPRFLCYDCHGFRSYASWNPYTYACSTYRVVIWDDPYFYPSYRYGPTRVVFTSPPRARVRFEFKERMSGEAWSPLIRTRQPPRRTAVRYLEPAAASIPREVAPSRSRPITTGARPAAPVTRPERSATPETASPRRASPTGVLERTRPAAQPRPATEPGRTSVATPARPERSADERPVLQRRPSSAVRPPARPPSDRPSGSVGTARPSGSPATARGGSTRAVLPRQPSARQPSARRPSVRQPGARPSGATRPSVRAPSRPTPSVRPGTGSRPSVSRASPPRRPVVRTKPPTRRKPGGGGGL